MYIQSVFSLNFLNVVGQECILICKRYNIFSIWIPISYCLALDKCYKLQYMILVQQKILKIDISYHIIS